MKPAARARGIGPPLPPRLAGRAGGAVVRGHGCGRRWSGCLRSTGGPLSIGAVRVGLALLLAASVLAGACRSPEPGDRAAAPDVAGAPAPTGAASGAHVPGGPLRLLDVAPPPGADVLPRGRFALRFDRPLDPRATEAGGVTFEYPDPRATFVADPFRLTATWLEADGTVLYVAPPDLLPGRDVRLLLRSSLRGVDGSALAADPSAPEGIARVLAYRVLELPPP